MPYRKPPKPRHGTARGAFKLSSGKAPKFGAEPLRRFALLKSGRGTLRRFALRKSCGALRRFAWVKSGGRRFRALLCRSAADTLSRFALPKRCGAVRRFATLLCRSRRSVAFALCLAEVPVVRSDFRALLCQSSGVGTLRRFALRKSRGALSHFAGPKFDRRGGLSRFAGPKPDRCAGLFRFALPKCVVCATVSRRFRYPGGMCIPVGHSLETAPQGRANFRQIPGWGYQIPGHTKKPPWKAAKEEP